MISQKHLTGAFAALLVLVSCVLSSDTRKSPDYRGSFQLTVKPDTMSAFIAHNVTLRCAFKPSAESRIKQVFRMRIVKKTKTGWDLIAEKRDNVGRPAVLVNAFVTGSITGRAQDAFLELTWRDFEDEIYGVYRCDVLGYDDEFEIVPILTTEVDIVEPSLGFKEMAAILAQTQEEVLLLRNYVEMEIPILRNENEALKIQANQSAQSLELLNSLVSWPAGYYALLQPKTGCPVDLAFFGGTHRFHKMNTESSGHGTQNDMHSSALPKLTNNLANEKHFTTIEFCEVNKEFNTKPWPLGSYCIHKILHQPCPKNFVPGSVYSDLEDTKHASEGRNNIADETQSLNFCCMSFGKPSDKMQLPTESPFILYRKGGTCQAVEGMKVSAEFFQIDTEDSGNRDKVCDICPDVDASNTIMKYHLCYYTPS